MSLAINARLPFRATVRVLSLAITMSVLAACGGQGAPAAQAARTTAQGQGAAARVDTVPVEVARASRRAISATYSGTATLDAPAEAQVVTKTTGIILRLMAEEGDTVQAGQVLARLDPDRKELALAQSQAQLRKLESEFKRSQELFARQLVSADAYEKLRSELEVQRAAVDIMRLELSYTNVVAPISGVVAQRMVKEGNLVQTNAPLFRIVDTSRLEAVLNVPERELATMKPGLPVKMHVDAVPGMVFEGKVDRVAPVVDSGSGTFRVVATFPGAELLRPGMFGRVEVVYDQREDVLVVPRDALVEDDGVTAVFAVRDGKAVRTPVQLGYVNGSFAEVRAGIDEGDEVVTVGKVTLRDGASVEVVNAPALGDGSQVARQGNNGAASE
ncbi:MAG: efflux RND transporter periplasmic adaptor subunit [Rehaibacterium terrae]|uniref:efflux RND transporter periplasmic adaptor subunit n=1 Tax=Rehaibacterium terrae TaxID=1341696 RepID=UPI00391C09FB